MKLLRWAAAGASVYVVYRYSIGRKAKGENVLISFEKDMEDIIADASAEPEDGAEPAGLTAN